MMSNKREGWQFRPVVLKVGARDLEEVFKRAPNTTKDHMFFFFFF